jgi:hypothetical protein
VEREGGDAFALLHHLGGAVARPHPHKQVDVVRLVRQRQDSPACSAHLPSIDSRQRAATGLTKTDLRRLGAPDEVVDDQVDTMLVSLVLHVEMIGYDNSEINRHRRMVG